MVNWSKMRLQARKSHQKKTVYVTLNTFFQMTYQKNHTIGNLLFYPNSWTINVRKSITDSKNSHFSLISNKNLRKILPSSAGVTNLFAIAGHFVSYHWVSGPHNFLVILWNLFKTKKIVHQQKQTAKKVQDCWSRQNASRAVKLFCGPHVRHPWSRGWAQGQVAWDKMTENLPHLWCRSQKNLKPPKNCFIMDLKPCQVFWGFEQLSSIIYWCRS